jgi:hypothetical protein
MIGRITLMAKFRIGDYVEVTNTRTEAAKSRIGERFIIEEFEKEKSKGLECVVAPFLSLIGARKGKKALISQAHLRLIDYLDDLEFTTFLEKCNLLGEDTIIHLEENVANENKEDTGTQP